MAAAEPLRVAVAAWTYFPGEMGGSETYARELLRRLSARPDVEVTTLVPREAKGRLPGDHEVVGRATGARPSAAGRLRSIASGLRPDPETRRAIAAADLVHHPFTVPVPTLRRVPQVRTLADVQHLDLPELFSRAERAYRSWAYDHAARGADAVLTISAFSRDRIVERLGIDPDKVQITPLGVVPEDFDSSPERDPVVLYPARAWRHKNHARLIEAVALVRRDHPELRLVLTGGGTDRLPGLPGWVEARGLVATQELRRLYARAACLAFPSLYEGFGLPPLEAMASGCPVAAADIGAIPEVCGDAAVLFDPYDVRAIAEAIRVALGAGPVQLERGLERARAFSWDRCAEATVSAYRGLVG